MATPRLSRQSSRRNQQAQGPAPDSDGEQLTNEELFATTAKSAATLTTPSTFAYTRPSKPDDAVALLPLLLGAIPQAPSNSDTLLFKPFSRKYSPTSNIYEHTWELRTKPIVEKVFADMRACGIKFSSLITYEKTIADEEIIAQYQQGDATTRTALQRKYDAIFTKEKTAHTPFLQILDNINTYDKMVSKAYNKYKSVIRANAKTLRTCIKNKYGKNLKAVGEDNGKVLKAELYTKLNDAFIARTKRMKAFHFSAPAIICGTDVWNGISELKSAWNAASNWESIVENQEKLASRTANACMRLENDYYDQLYTVMSEPGFIETVLKELVSEKLPSVTSKNETLTPESKANWIKFVTGFFKDILIERLEILQSHLYTFFTATMGTHKNTMEITMNFFNAILHCSFGPAFVISEVVAVNNSSRKDSQDRIAILEHFEHYSNLKVRKHDVLVKFFTNDDNFKTFTEEDLLLSTPKLVTEGMNGAAWFGTTVIDDIVFPHAYASFNTWWTTNFPPSIKFNERSAVVKSDGNFMYTTTHMAREQFRKLINTKMCNVLKVEDVPLAHIMATLIAHANGVLDNAFVVAVCAGENNNGTDYLRRIYNPLTALKVDADGKSINVLNSKTNPLVNIPSWIDIQERRALTTLSAILTSPDNADYVTLLDNVFKVKKLVKPGFTRPTSAPAKKQGNKGGDKSTARPQSASAPKGRKSGDKPGTPGIKKGDAPRQNNAPPQNANNTPENKIGKRNRGPKK